LAQLGFSLYAHPIHQRDALDLLRLHVPAALGHGEETALVLSPLIAIFTELASGCASQWVPLGILLERADDRRKLGVRAVRAIERRTITGERVGPQPRVRVDEKREAFILPPDGLRRALHIRQRGAQPHHLTEHHGREQGDDKER
jgi:hypothetical protein